MVHLDDDDVREVGGGRRIWEFPGRKTTAEVGYSGQARALCGLGWDGLG
jgi:hypothetical protein